MAKSEAERRGDEALRIDGEERARRWREPHSMVGQGPPGASPNVRGSGENGRLPRSPLPDTSGNAPRKGDSGTDE